jgi:hypothetical protein
MPSGGIVPMGFINVHLPLVMLSLAYFLLFTVARSRESEEREASR